MGKVTTILKVKSSNGETLVVYARPKSKQQCIERGIIQYNPKNLVQTVSIIPKNFVFCGTGKTLHTVPIKG